MRSISQVTLKVTTVYLFIYTPLRSCLHHSWRGAGQAAPSPFPLARHRQRHSLFSTARHSFIIPRSPRRPYSQCDALERPGSNGLARESNGSASLRAPPSRQCPRPLSARSQGQRAASACKPLHLSYTLAFSFQSLLWLIAHSNGFSR